MKPVEEYWKYHDGCRLPSGKSTRWVAWCFDDKSYSKDRLFVVYAAGCCHCKQFWGWTLDIRRAMKFAKAMALKGCPKCKKRLSERKYKKLQKILRKYVDS